MPNQPQVMKQIWHDEIIKKSYNKMQYIRLSYKANTMHGYTLILTMQDRLPYRKHICDVLIPTLFWVHVSHIFLEPLYGSLSLSFFFSFFLLLHQSFRHLRSSPDCYMKAYFYQNTWFSTTVFNKTETYRLKSSWQTKSIESKLVSKITQPLCPESIYIYFGFPQNQ